MINRSLVVARVPGLALAVAVTFAATLLEQAERSLGGGVWIDPLVLAILLGTAVHSVAGLRQHFVPGVQFAAKPLLEAAIVLLGASVDGAALAGSGPGLLLATVGVVALSLPLGYGIARLLGLPRRLATLIACGNSICGNSAIMAAAPVIGAAASDVAVSISFTAALGVLVVLLLPSAVAAFGLSDWQYGVLAGMTVYAVPQVLAATVPVGAVSVQVGTLVKLLRVMMLAPVLFTLGLRQEHGAARRSAPVPPFVVGFALLMGLRTAGAIPPDVQAVIGSLSATLTVVSMAGLGLSVDLRAVRAAGNRVVVAASLSILALGALGLGAALLLG